MKRFIIAFTIILISLSAYPLSKDYNISSTGGTGIITYPSIDVSSSFEIGLGANWVFAPGSVISPALSIAIQNFNIGVAFDYSTYNEGWPKPLMVSLKYQIDKAGLGIYGDWQYNIDPNEMAFNFMLLGGNGFLGLTIGGGWDITMGLGISSTPRFDWALNTFIGMQKAIYKDFLFLNIEFGNYSYRRLHDPYFADDHRGIFNIGLNVVPANWIAIAINFLDVLDGNRSIMAELNFRFNP
jgi:hypothetical protein